MKDLSRLPARQNPAPSQLARKTGRDPSLALRMTAGLLKVICGTAHYDPIGNCIL